jgi:hypothetical protein
LRERDRQRGLLRGTSVGIARHRAAQEERQRLPEPHVLLLFERIHLTNVVSLSILLPTAAQFTAVQAELYAEESRDAVLATQAGDLAAAERAASARKASASGEKEASRKEADASGACSDAFALVRDAYTLVFRSAVFGWGGVLLLCQGLALYMLQTSFLIEQYHYYLVLFGASSAADLVSSYSLVFAIAGVPITIGLGILADLLSPADTLLAIDTTALAFGVTAAIGERAAQYCAMILLTLLTNAYNLAVPPLVMLYAPQKLFGTLFGFFEAVIGVLQVRSPYS